jgi:hypothetical protein
MLDTHCTPRDRQFRYIVHLLGRSPKGLDRQVRTQQALFLPRVIYSDPEFGQKLNLAALLTWAKLRSALDSSDETGFSLLNINHRHCIWFPRQASVAKVVSELYHNYYSG